MKYSHFVILCVLRSDETKRNRNYTFVDMDIGHFLQAQKLYLCEYGYRSLFVSPKLYGVCGDGSAPTAVVEHSGFEVFTVSEIVECFFFEFGDILKFSVGVIGQYFA